LTGPENPADKAIYDFSRALELTAAGDKGFRFLIYEMRGDAQFGKAAWRKTLR
jgi:hypothetical protein